jgi:hypothetical protein
MGIENEKLKIEKGGERESVAPLPVFNFQFSIFNSASGARR